MLTAYDLYRGRFEHVPNRKQNSVRIFISSTFTDTVDERDALIRDVYPELEKYCEQTYNVQFQYSDMRWGIQEHAAEDHSTVELCLQELDQCCQLSLATNCVILLSHRYGGRMLPARIRQPVFEAFGNVLSTEDKTYINQFYQLDENPVEHMYVLRPIDSAAKKEWEATEIQLQQILRSASDLCMQMKTISENERNEFHISVTAKEIYRALENNTNYRHRMIACLREIEDINQFDAKIKPKFIDTTESTEKLFNDTKTAIRNALPTENILTYRVKWNDTSRRKIYMDKFKQELTDAIKRQIDYHLAGLIHTKPDMNMNEKTLRMQSRSKNVLYDDVLEHTVQCKMLNERYYPREDILSKVKAMILSDMPAQPCVLYGNSGTGKSSLMAEIAMKIGKWFANPSFVSIVIRFLGATPQSSDVRLPLINLIQQICIIYNIKLTSPIYDSMTVQNLKQILEHILSQIPENEQLVLLLDSIDQLQVEYYDCSKWLPMNYPKNVKCIVSTIPVIEYKKTEFKILEGLKSLFGNTYMIEITEFNEHIAQQVFQSWLERDRRRLTPLQMEWLQPKFLPNSDYGEPQPTPLFLSLLYEITRSWHSFDDSPDPTFLKKKSTRGAIKYLYTKLSEKHGVILFERAMAYLRQAGGLSETELEDMLSADNEVLQSIFTHYLPPLSIFRLPSTLWIRIRNDMHKYLVEKTVDNVNVIYFYHRSFAEHGVFGGDEAKEVELIRRAYYAGNIGGFRNLHDQPFEIKSQKLIEKKHGNTSLRVDRRLLKQAPYVTYVKGKGPIYNMRRINQLCMNLENICCEPWFLYDYDFISSYLSCYKISELRASEWFYPELRFLLTQYEACSFVLDKHPKNFAFELSSRLFPFIDILPELIYNLFQNCLSHCNLLRLEDEEKSLQSCMSRYKVGSVYAMDLDLDSSNLFVLLPDKLLSFHLSVYYLAGKINEYELPANIFTSIKCSQSYVCLYSSQSLFVLKCGYTQQCILQLNIHDLFYIDFIHIATLLICSRSSKSIDIWNCSKKLMIGQYSYNESVLQCYTLKIDDGVLIKVILKSGLIQYLRININEQDENSQVLFTPIASLQDKPRNESILFNHNTDVYYSEGQSCICLYHFDRFANDCFKQIENLPPLNRIVYRHRCIFEEAAYNAALVWLTKESLVIFHSCGKHFIISGKYDEVCRTPSISGSDFICCLNREISIISIFQWKCKDGIHIYRLLAHFQVNEHISDCVCNIDDESGITVYCTLKNGELRKYYATVMAYLLDQPITSLLKPIVKEQITHLQIHDEYIVTLDETKSILKLFTFAEHLSFVMKLYISNVVFQYNIITPYILILDSKNILFIYAISSTPKLLFETTEFQYNVIKIHPFAPFFFIINGDTQQLFQININSPFNLHHVTDIKLEFRSLLSVISADQSTLFILSDDYSTLAAYNSNENTIKYFATQINKNTRIKNICSFSKALIFHDNDDQIYLKCIITDDKPVISLEHADFFATKGNCIALLNYNIKEMIVYDVERLLRGTIRLQTLCDTVCFSEDGKYLFVISYKESFLFMYQVDNGKCLEKLFIENLSLLIQATTNRLILSCNNQLVIMATNRDTTLPLKRDTDTPSKICPLFENAEWIDCHEDKDWIATNSDSANNT